MREIRPVPRPNTFPLYDRILGGRLADIIRAARAEGESFEAIARRLQAEHDVDVTGETVRKWHLELEAAS